MGLMTLLLVVLVWLAVEATVQQRSVNRAYAVIDAAEADESLALDGEAGVRGFLLTKDRRLLQSFLRTRAKFPIELAHLKWLIGDQPELHGVTDQIRVVSERWTTLASDAIKPKPLFPRTTYGLVAKMYLDEVRGGLDRIITYEHGLVSAAAARQQHAAVLLLIVLGGGTFLVGLLVSFQSVRTIRALSRQYEVALELVQRQTNELRTSYAELDRRVEERTRDLNAANRELEIFSYSAAHDLRAPLRWIIGTNRLFMEDYGKLIPKEGLDDLEKVSAAATRLSRLIDSLLEMARLGKVEIRRVTVNLSDIATQTVEELRGRDWAGAVDVTVQPEICAMGDPVLLSLVMQNLLENAFKFCASKGGHVEVSATHEGGELIVSVSDNGVGFDNSYSDKLFQPFERLHRGEEYAGTGMGLANAKRIVERHGGRIWADGKLGEGATFNFALPDVTKEEE